MCVNHARFNQNYPKPQIQNLKTVVDIRTDSLTWLNKIWQVQKSLRAYIIRQLCMFALHLEHFV